MPDLGTDASSSSLANGASGDSVAALQRNLRSLGYLKSGIDGSFGPATAKAVSALQYDLLHNDGSGSDGRAPVAVKDYNLGRVMGVTGTVDQQLLNCIADILADNRWPQLPFSEVPVQDNQRALASIAAMPPGLVPIPFLIAILFQESGGKHFREPSGGDRDSYVVVGTDTNDPANPTAITSRGYGIGQFTVFHHPPRADELACSISDPVGNVQQAANVLRDKFDHFIVGSGDKQADDRIQEVGAGPLQICKYAPGDPRYLRACVACVQAVEAVPIQAGLTPVFAGAGITYSRTQYHVGSYTNVPVRAEIPCDWPYAVRRYNGSGTNSYDYQAEVLVRIRSEQGLLESAAAATG